MLKNQYGIDALIYLKYFWVHYDPNEQYAYICARDTPVNKLVADDIKKQVKDHFKHIADSMTPVKKRADEDAINCQRRAFVILINAVDVVRHQGVPAFEWAAGTNDAELNSQHAMYDALIGPIGRGGLFNLIPTRLEPTWKFYPPLTRPTRVSALILGIIAKYTAKQYPCIAMEQWNEWCAMRCFDTELAASCCACGRCSNVNDVKPVEEWTPRCKDIQKYNPYDLKNGVHSPMWYVVNSFASGTSVDQVHTTLAAMERKNIKPGVDPKYMVCAVLSYIKEVGFVRSEQFDIKRKVYGLPCHNNQSAGFSTYQRGESETFDKIYKFAWEVNQQGTEWPSKMTCVEHLEKIRQYIKDGGDYNPDMWPQLVAKLAVKAEMKGPGSSRLKCRVFFTVAYLKYLFDYLVLHDGMQHTYGKAGVAIGLKWKGGDAERLARKHHAYDQGWFHIEADAEKLDQSLLAAILVVVFSIPFMMSRFDKFVSPEWREFMRQLSAYVVDGCAVKLIKWVGNQALWVIGIMFSGMLGTSWGDSTYMSLLVSCFHYHIYDQMMQQGDKELAQEFKKTIHPRDIYGDDMLLSYHTKYWKYIIGGEICNTTDLSILSNYMLEAGGIAIKSSEAFVYVGESPFFSQIDGKTGLLVKHGPKFLQRRFVRATINGIKCALPWRVVTDYYMKAAYTFTDADIDYYWIIKWRSLQYDTCGTNKVAYDFLDFLQNELLSLYADKSDQVEADVQRWVVNQLGDARDCDGMRRYKKLGLRSEYYGKHLKQTSIAALFAWDEYEQLRRSEINGLRYYHKDGTYEKKGLEFDLTSDYNVTIE